MFDYGWVFILVLGAFPQVSFATKTGCPAAFSESVRNLTGSYPYFTPYEGEVVTTGPFDNSTFAANTVYLLGQGQGGGGHVYRLKSKTSNARRTIKVYSNPEVLERDEDSFEIFESLPRIPNFGLARHDKIDQRKLEIETVDGRTVKSVRGDPKLPSELRNQISVAYELVSETLLKSVEKQYGSRDQFEIYRGRTLWSVSFRDAYSHPRKINFKPDNVIVEATTLNLMLIDPF